MNKGNEEHDFFECVLYICTWRHVFVDVFCACSCVNASEWADPDESHIISRWFNDCFRSSSSWTFISHVISPLVLFFFSSSLNPAQNSEPLMWSLFTCIPHFPPALFPFPQQTEKKLLEELTQRLWNKKSEWLCAANETCRWEIAAVQNETLDSKGKERKGACMEPLIKRC